MTLLRRLGFGGLLLAVAAAGGALLPGSDALAKDGSPCAGKPAPPDGGTSNANALALLGSVTQLQSALGWPVLTSNLDRTLDINATASPQQRAQALEDAYITNDNANQLADGLGARMGEAYRRDAFYRSEDDGKTTACGQVAASVGDLIKAVNATSRADATAGKLGFAAPGSLPFTLPAGGRLDVIGSAYHHPRGTSDRDPAGNARPFLVAPIVVYPGRDFFKTDSDSRLMLWGPTAADEKAGLTGSSLVRSPSFPSGHTTYGYSEALALAMMVPERYAALVWRGAEYGDSRIVIGAHHAVDVIAGRTLATYDLANDLAAAPGYAATGGRGFRATLAAAAHDLRAFLKTVCPDIAACAFADPIVRSDDARIFASGTWRKASPGEVFAFRLNYALTPIGRADLPPDPVPPEAAFLLETRFPYLSAAQRVAILRTAQGPSGRFLASSPRDGAPLSSAGLGPEAQAGFYSRVNLFAAAQGFRSFEETIVVEQDSGKLADPLSREFADLADRDTWSNDIGGPGGLTKRGPGTLVLAGRTTFTGDVAVEAGTLGITGSIAAAAKVSGGATLDVTGRVGDVVLSRGATLATSGNAKAMHLTIAQGARLKVKFAMPPTAGARLALISADRIDGRFSKVEVEPKDLGDDLVYTPNAIFLDVRQKRVAADPKP